MTWTVAWNREDAFAYAPPVECEREFDNFDDAVDEAEELARLTTGVTVRNDDTGDFVPWPWG